MANFDARTTCNSPLVTDHKAAAMVCSRYGGVYDLQIEQKTERRGEEIIPTDEHRLAIFGYDWFQVYPFEKDEDGEPTDHLDYDEYDATEVFLKEIQPYLAEDLVVQSIGSEKRSFPFSAYSWIVPKGEGEILTAGLPDNMEQYKKFHK